MLIKIETESECSSYRDSELLRVVAGPSRLAQSDRRLEDLLQNKNTSGELNFLTPISGKDITREFTAGIKERCMLPVINCQAVTSVLDPVTGHISTVLTTTTAANAQQQPLLGGGDSSPTAAATNKKPSYLNLACCVNGYSNLTTYDSKLRQDINKSREVSPSRPIIATLHYNRTDSGTGGHLLAAPTLSYVSMNNTINNNNNYSATGIGGGGGNRMLKMNGSAGVVNGAGRMRGINGSVMSPPGAGTDMTDNVASLGMFNGNGSFVGSMRTKVISSQSQISSHTRDDGQAQLMTPKKSFIQQRVEKLYGASDVVVLNKQNYSSSERKYLNNIANENNGGTPVKMMVHHHGMAGPQHPSSIGNGTARNGAANGMDSLRHVTNGASNGASFSFVDENNKQINGEVGEEADVDSLPVLRHLRPEFRAQLQIFSPKKVPKPSPNRTALNGNVTHANGSNTAEENANVHPVSKPRHQTQSNGNSYTDHLEQLSVSREEQIPDHHHKNLKGTDGTTHRSAMVAQLSSQTTRTSSTTTTTINNGRHTEHEQEDALNSGNRHHSNVSARSADPQQTDVIEQHRHESASQSCRSASSTTVSSSTVSSSTVMVEEQMRSLVVVSSTSGDDNGVGRMSTSDGSSATTTTAAVPDEQNALTVVVVAPSVIENGKQQQQQNGSVQQSSHSTSNNNASNGLEHVPAPAYAVDQELCAVKKSGSEEGLNCDSSTIQQPVVTADTMRTSNGGTAVMTMASVKQSDAERDIQSSNKPPAPANTSSVEASKNGTDSSSNNNNNHVLDGNHFLRILKTEQKRLGTMADDVEKEINQLKADGTVVLGEDINGYILVAVGKARLLCSQKMKQFEDLCYTNLNQSPDEKFQTTGEDLRGFWDMVMLQVNNVDASFAEIDSFRNNGWRKPTPKSPPPARNGTTPRTKLVKRPYKTPTTASNGGGTSVTDGSNGVEAKKASAALAAAKREAQRKQLMEMKRKQKLANSQQQAAVEIFAPTNEEPAQNGDDNSAAAASVLATSALVDTS